MIPLVFDGYRHVFAKTSTLTPIIVIDRTQASSVKCAKLTEDENALHGMVWKPERCPQSSIGRIDVVIEEERNKLETARVEYMKKSARFQVNEAKLRRVNKLNG